jgi:Integrase core domain
MLTDNGVVFTAAPRRGRCAMEIELAALGISYRHSTPYHPQTCGKVERFHQTLKRYLAKQPKAADPAQLQAQLDRFADYYNSVRPHRALHRGTPAEAFAGRPKAGPSGIRVAVPVHYRVRKDRIHKTGAVTLRHNSRLHHIGLGRKLAGTRVLVLVDDLRVRVITEDGEILRELTLDPTRDYQPRSRSS